MYFLQQCDHMSSELCANKVVQSHMDYFLPMFPSLTCSPSGHIVTLIGPTSLMIFALSQTHELFWVKILSHGAPIRSLQLHNPEMKQSIVFLFPLHLNFYGLSHLSVSFLPPTLLCDNLTTILLYHNLILHNRTKHIELNIHFVFEQVIAKRMKNQHVPSSFQVADTLTKPLDTIAFQELRTKLKFIIFKSP